MTKPRKKKKLGWGQLLRNAPEEARILVVEDEAPVRKSLEKLVTRFGYEVKVAASAEEADSWMSDLDFDLVLLDIQLPGMEGPEFMTWALGKDPELAVIMMTGLDDPELAIRCLDLGARNYMVKPPDPEFLRRAIRDALAVRKLLQERNALAY